MPIVGMLLSASAPIHASAWRRVWEAFALLMRNVAEERVVKRAIEEMNRLDDRTLRDLGITRSEIESRIRHGKQKRPYY